jgi:hypothetical protein
MIQGGAYEGPSAVLTKKISCLRFNYHHLSPFLYQFRSLPQKAVLTVKNLDLHLFSWLTIHSKKGKRLLGYHQMGVGNMMTLDR